ncbi:MAG: hypothetical protein KGL40_03130 [Rhodocyclaceae bacterium]|nr:hypothetical protein [Rhodocyclaceae bacterium]
MSKQCRAGSGYDATFPCARKRLMLKQPLLRLLLVCAIVLAAHVAGAQESEYEKTLAQWKSYEDVGKWLDRNFVFDHGRLNTVLASTRAGGPGGLLAHKPATTFDEKRGYCTDSANFAMQALNRINPDYQAKLVFIKNRYGQPHHWVTGFMLNGKVMIMDYGAGPEWSAMRGLHGPYETLAQYQSFLRGLGIRQFDPESVEWRATFPGKED